MDHKPKVLDTAVRAWRDAFRALGRMPLLFAVSLILYIAMIGLTHWLDNKIGSGGIAAPLLELLLQLAGLAALVPLYLGVHRFILRDETTPGYRLSVTEPRFYRFYGAIVALTVLSTRPGWLGSPTGGIGLALMVASMIVILVITIRLTLWFPAIAVDAPGATLENALADTSGHFWRILATGFVAVLPALVLFAALATLLSSMAAFVVLGLFPVTFLILTSVMIATASHLYAGLGDRLTRVAPVP
jgi:hypothetical protein